MTEDKGVRIRCTVDYATKPSGSNSHRPDPSLSESVPFLLTSNTYP